MLDGDIVCNMSQENRNLLLISIDSLRRDYCSFINNEEVTTPFLDEISEDSTIFTSAISPSTWTLPVHTSIFTGLYPPEHRMVDKDRHVGQAITLSERLNNSGYKSHSFAHNNWLKIGELLQGFEHHHTPFPGHVNQGIRQIIDGVTQPSLRSFVEGIKQVGRKPIVRARRASLRYNHLDSTTVANVTRLLNSQDEPFLYFVHLNGVHNPYKPHVYQYRRFGDASFRELKSTIAYQHDLQEDRPQIYAGTEPIDGEFVPIIEDLYRGTIYRTDRHIEEIFRSLREKNLLQNTTVVIFGDHGDHLGDDGNWGHQFSVADAVIRVPLLIHDPNDEFKPGVVEDLVQLNDLFPTLLSIAGVQIPDTNSIDLTTQTREAAFSYYHAPESYIQNVCLEELSPDQLPPKLQFSAWAGPSKKGYWFPETMETKGQERLVDVLKKHHSHLDSGKIKYSDGISEQVKQNLQNMGYI